MVPSPKKILIVCRQTFYERVSLSNDATIRYPIIIIIILSNNNNNFKFYTADNLSIYHIIFLISILLPKYANIA